MLKVLQRVPGGLMIIPLLIGAFLSTIDRTHLEPIQQSLQWLGAPPLSTVDGINRYEFLEIGGFATALTSVGATTLIAMFLVCVAAQIDFRVGSEAVKKGAIITVVKLLVAISCGYASRSSHSRWAHR